MAEKSKTKAKKEKKSTKKKSSKKSKAKSTSDVSKFAVIEIAGTQIKASEGDMFEVNKLEGEKGDKVKKDDYNILMISEDRDVKLGDPYLKDANVEISIDSQKRGKKVVTRKFKAKSRYRRKYGHKPHITRIKVDKIS
jgi:large subunit ribosomal protein L21